MLGVLIGDGHFGITRLLLTTADEEIVKHVRAVLPDGMVCERAATSSSYDYNIRRQKPYSETPWPKHSPLFTLLREMGLMGTRAADKHVPASYLFASSATRLAVLQGLLDSDGCVSSRDRYFVEFGTNSERLARDVAFLVQSLSGTASIGIRLRFNRRSYRVTIKLPANVLPFRLTRKASLYQPATKYLPRRAIMSVNYVGEMEAQCIVVASDAQLYITDDCVVTHNTFFVKALAREIGFNAIALNAENILGGIVGTSERNLRAALDLARAISPVLLFVDEIDQSDMSRRGGASGNPVASNLFSGLLRFMGDPTLRGKVIVFFASNRPDLLDSALTRFGRIDETIPMRLADETGRLGIVRAQVALQKSAIEDEAAAYLAKTAEKFSAADIEAVVSKARKLSRRRGDGLISLADAQRAMQHIRPETPKIADFYSLLAIQACKDTELLEPDEIALLEDPAGFKRRMREAKISVPANLTKRDEEREERSE